MIKKNQQQNLNLVINEYPVCKDLEKELKNLENWFTELTEEKIEYEIKINSFNSNYMLRLGGLIEQILQLRVDIYGHKITNQQSGISININLNKLFEKAKLNYDEFKKTCQQQLQDLPQFLDESEKQHLKTIYRKASRLCHPDKLAEDAKAKGEEYFKALNEAYRHQDLKRVQDILLKLESEATSLVIAARKIDNRVLLQEKITLLYEQIATLEQEIKCLLESEIYRRIKSITDMDRYFVKLEQELKAELEILNGKKYIN